MKALNKNIIKEIFKSKGRFISILLMITIGVLIFVGLKITGPVMTERADEYFDKTNGADIVVSSSIGLNDEDIEEIRSAKKVNTVELGYNFDVKTKKNDELIRLNSITRKVNKLNIIKGRGPKKENEIVLDRELMEKYSIGDTISFKKEKVEEDKEQSLNRYKYKVVGFATSPDYPDMINLGTSTIGDGEITGLGFVLKDNFNLENYSVAKVTFSDLKNLDFSDEEYRQKAKKHKKEMDKIFAERKVESFDDTKDELASKIDDGESEIEDAEKKIKDGEKKIKDGKEKLKKAKSDYDKGKNQLSTELSKAENELNDAQKKVDKSEKEINDKIKEIEKGEKSLTEAKIQIENGRYELDKAIEEYYKNENDLNNAINSCNSQITKLTNDLNALENQQQNLPKYKKEYDELVTKRDLLNNSKNDLNNKVNSYNDDLNSINSQIKAIKEQIAENSTEDLLNKLKKLENDKQVVLNEIKNLKSQISKIDTNISTINSKISTLETIINNSSNIEENKAQIKGQISQINAKKQELELKLTELKKGYSIIDKKEVELEEANGKYQKSLKDIETGKKQLEKGKESLAAGISSIKNGRDKLDFSKSQGEAELASALKKIEENEKTLNENEEKFEKEKEKAEDKIEDAQEDLETARDYLKIIKAPRYTVDSMESNSNIYTFYDEASRLDIISNIFPVFFFFIALLVSLTTMTRMVDEQRLEIGTLKALGYSNYSIVKKYFIYGGIASVIGSILGIIIGHKLITPLIFEAYAANYVFPTTNIPFNVKYSIMSVIIGVGCTALAGTVATWSSLRQNAAILMRGKPPKGGNRILLEKVLFIWKKLSFMQKVTMRNLFRYKKRMLMTIIGIAGCTGLIFMGFGIKDSITSMEKKQYDEIFSYDLISLYDEELSPGGYESYQTLLEDENKVKNSSNINFGNFKVDAKKGPDHVITMISPEKDKDLKKYVSLRDRHSQKKIELGKDGAVITEKIADLLNVKPGDKITVKDDNNKKIKIKISKITENYTGNYLYMSPKYYEKVFYEDFESNADIIQLKAKTEKAKSKTIEKINNNESIVALVNNNQSRNLIDGLLGTLDVLVLVIISCSCILAFVVLYNLTNINISERIRELSTIKVLGFYNNEVTSYVYRETFLLTLIGILVGYLIGFGMHFIIINNLIPDMAMLDPHIFLTNYVLSAVITMAFAAIVMIVVHIKLKHINMVEALKAIE